MRRSSLVLATVIALLEIALSLSGQTSAHHRVDPAVYVEALREAAPGLAFLEQGELAFGRHEYRSAFPTTDVGKFGNSAVSIPLSILATPTCSGCSPMKIVPSRGPSTMELRISDSIP